MDVTQVTTNDIHAMLKTYGVEAARATIVREVTNVFGAYGIQVRDEAVTIGALWWWW